MKKTSDSTFHSSRLSIAKFAVLCALAAAHPAVAQDAGLADPGQSLMWRPGAINHAQQMRRYRDPYRGAQPTPPAIPMFEVDPDRSGAVGTFQPGGATFTSNNAFFQNLGTNDRTCFTCHQPANGWTVSAAGVKQRFAISGGNDPIFRLVDGATCPTDDVSTPGAKLRSYKLLLEKGLIRIGLPLPAAPPLQFSVTKVAAL